MRWEFRHPFPTPSPSNFNIHPASKHTPRRKPQSKGQPTGQPTSALPAILAASLKRGKISKNASHKSSSTLFPAKHMSALAPATSSALPIKPLVMPIKPLVKNASTAVFATHISSPALVTPVKPAAHMPVKPAAQKINPAAPIHSTATHALPPTTTRVAAPSTIPSVLPDHDASSSDAARGDSSSRNASRRVYVKLRGAHALHDVLR